MCTEYLINSIFSQEQYFICIINTIFSQEPETTSFLIKVSVKETEPLNVVFDFVFDRLRAVRCVGDSRTTMTFTFVYQTADKYF